ncbi:hypothetical protein D3C73_582800 [compost metagenome]
MNRKVTNMKNFTLYSSNFDLEQVAELIGQMYSKESIWMNEDKTDIKVVSKKWFRKTETLFTIMTRQTNPDQLTNMINSMGHFYKNIPARNETVHEKLLIKISTLNMIIDIAAEVDISDKRYIELLNVTKQLDGILLVGSQELLDYNGKLILDMEGNSDIEDLIVTAHTSLIDQGLHLTEASLQRKERSERILTKQQIPYNTHLPAIADANATTIRRVDAIARRAVALCIVALKGECHGTGHELAATNSLIDQVMKQYDAYEFLTPKEQAFIINDDPSPNDVAYFSWCYEGFWVMLWALGYVEELDYPSTICDVEAAVSILHRFETYEEFLTDAQVRTKHEIVDAADLIYRYDWVCVDSRIHNRPAPGELDGGIVYERHRALNWLTSYMEQDWDQVTTNT